MAKIKGKLIKVDPGCWSDDRGNDKSGYNFYIDKSNQGYAIDEKTKNGIFFKNNYKKMMNNDIIFTSDEWGYGVKFSKETIKLFS